MATQRRIIFLLLAFLALPLAGCAGMKAREEPQDPKLSSQELLEKARAATTRGEGISAVLFFQQVLELEPEHREALLAVGNLTLELGNPDEAERNFDRLLVLEPGHLDALSGKGFALLRKGEYVLAEQTLQAVAERDPDRWRVCNALGVLADLRGDYPVAHTFYDRAVALQPDELAVINNKGYSLIMAGRYAEAENVLRQGLTRGPGYLRLHNNLAIALAWQGKYKEAVRLLSDVVPGEGSAYNNVGYIAQLRGDHRTAKAFFEKAFSLAPSYNQRAAFNLKRLEESVN